MLSTCSSSQQGTVSGNMTLEALCWKTPAFVLLGLPLCHTEVASVPSAVTERMRDNTACCGHFPLCFTFSKSSTISPLVSKPSHPTPVFVLYKAFSKSHSLLALVKLPLISSIPNFPRLIPTFAHFRHTANALPILSTLPHNGLLNSHLLLLPPGSVLLL